MLSDAHCREPIESAVCYCNGCNNNNLSVAAALKRDDDSTAASRKNLVDDLKSVKLCASPVRIGGSLLLCGRRRSQFPFQCLLGPDWPMVLLVYVLIIGINAIVLGVVSTGLGWPVLLIGLTGTAFLLYFYSAVACSDPGIIFKEKGNSNDLIETKLEDLNGLAINGVNVSSISGSENGGNSAAPAIAGAIIANGSDNGSGSGDELESGLAGGTRALLPISSSSGATNSGSGGSSSSNSNNSTGSNSNTNNNVQRAGSVPKTMECGHCQLQRPITARHCVYCDVCVDELDHHCPWCGKCIGERNMKAFQAFLGILCFQFYFLAGTLIYYLISATTSVNLPKGPAA